MSKWWLMADVDRQVIERVLEGPGGISDNHRALALRIIRLRFRETDAEPTDCLECGGDGKAAQAEPATCPVCGGSGKRPETPAVPGPAGEAKNSP